MAFFIAFLILASAALGDKLTVELVIAEVFSFLLLLFMLLFNSSEFRELLLSSAELRKLAIALHLTVS